MSGLLFAALDTSNYTTSAALCDAEGHVLCNAKAPLPVAEGERGLRQSDAVFHHVKNLPTVASELRTAIASSAGEIAAVGVSRSPRDAEGSYMPCFLSGVAAAETAAGMLGVPVFRFSHQAGHVMAALYSSGAVHLLEKEFIAFHVSGGTTDILYVRPHEEYGFSIEKIGGTRDINAGQAIDRSGVYMGLRFPAGAEMERLASVWQGKIPRGKLSVSDLYCNLSGVENQAARLYDETQDAGLVSAYVLDFVGRTLCRLRDALREKYGRMPIVYAGGVMSNRKLAAMLAEENAWFSQPAFSADNAAGIALLTAYRYRKAEMHL